MSDPVGEAVTDPVGVGVAMVELFPYGTDVGNPVLKMAMSVIRLKRGG